jgi:RNA polymerase sigma-54 factor
LLEEVPAEGEPAAGTEPEVAAAPPEPAPADAVTDERPLDDLPFDLTSVLFDQAEERSLVQQEEHDELPFENIARAGSSLADHLEEQLRFATEDLKARRVGAEIIGNLDDDGYLRAELGEIAERCGTTPEEVEKVLMLVQTFDPPGVGARTVQECLLIQLHRDPNPDPVSVEIIEKYFDDLSRRRYAEIARALRLSVDRIMESVEEIMALEPKPGRPFGGAESRYIVPDVSVIKMGGEYAVVLNEDGVPRLRVNSLYRTLLRGSGDDARQYVEQKLRSAMWLIKSVEQRQRTLRKVTQSIVKFQREFLERGLPCLRPLALKDVGDDIGMHESTISRVTTNKYVETPQGLFELKFFFHSGIASGDGEMVSSVSVKKMIQDLLAEENPAKPLSDQEVAQILKARNLTIARRTVAKYREELGLLPSHQRRLAPRRR